MRNAKLPMAQFDAGDFVTYMDVRGASPTKLSVLWKGPAQVEEAVSPWIFKP
jgi:hypothetical protein